jgi:hypothetical protein
MSKKEYTYDNGRSGVASAVSRIDKFMISQAIDERGGKIETSTSVRKLLDHSPLIITVWGQHTAPNNPPRFFDTSLLSDEKSKKEMLETWDGNRPPPSNDQDWSPWLEATIERVVHCNTRLVRAKKRAQRTHVRTHAKKIQLA